MLFSSQSSSSTFRSQSGFSIFFVMLLVVSVAILGMVLFTSTTTDLKSTKIHINKTKADYVAESALGWAKSFIAPRYELATHDSTGTSVAPNATGACGEIGHRIPSADLNSIIPSFYESGTTQYDGEGWIYCSTTDKNEALSATSNERISFMVFYPNINDVRIVARGEVNNEVAEIVMEADVRSVLRYGILSDGDLLPFIRRSAAFHGDIHANGNVYLTPMQEDAQILNATSITASGSIFRSINPFHARGDAKAAYVNNHQSNSWKTSGEFPLKPWGDGHISFKKNSSDIEMWAAYHNVSINGVDVTGDDPAAWSGTGATVEDNAPKLEIPSFTPPEKTTSSQGPDDCDCEVYTVDWSDLDETPQADWIYNPQFGTARIPGQTYQGWHARSSTGTNGDLSAAQNGNIQYGNYVQTTHQGNRGWARRNSYWGSDLEEYLTGESWYWGEGWYGGGDGGQWIRGLIYDLSKPNSYPRKCEEGGVVDFGNNTVFIINGDSLLYSLSVYTTGDIYVIGDFNVGWNARYRGIWDANLSDIDAGIANGAIKGASVVADSARIWYLTPWFLECAYGFGDLNRTGARDGNRGRNTLVERNIMSHSDWEAAGEFGSTRWFNRYPDVGMSNDNKYHYVGVYVGVFVTGAPMVTEGFYVNSRSKGIIQPSIPPCIESIDYNKHWLLFIGTEVYKSNAKVEGDWNPATNSFDNAYWTELQSSSNRIFTEGSLTLDRHNYWRTTGHGSGYPPRPGYVAPRVGRGYRSFYFQRDLKPVPEPPGTQRVMVNQSVYKK